MQYSVDIMCDVSFFLPILCSVNSDHDNRVAQKFQNKTKKYCDTATSRLKLFT